MKCHYLITMLEVTETQYEVWADTEEQAVAELDAIESDQVYQESSHRHEPEVVAVVEVSRRFQC